MKTTHAELDRQFSLASCISQLVITKNCSDQIAKKLMEYDGEVCCERVIVKTSKNSKVS
jgi:hypothetical protein